MPIRGANAHIVATAYHEAGHALAALHEGYCVEFAQVSHRWPGAGRVRIAGRRIGKNPFFPSAGGGAASSAWEISLSRRLAVIRTCLAGPLAEARYLAQPLRTLGAVDDLIKCDRIASTLANLHEELCRRYVDLPKFCPYEAIALERRRVRRWLGRPKTWRSVIDIAEALIQRGRLSGEELLQIDLIARTSEHQPVLPLVHLTSETESPEPLPKVATPVHFGCWSVGMKVPAPTAPSESVPVPAKIKAAWVRALPWMRRRYHTDHVRTRRP